MRLLKTDDRKILHIFYLRVLLSFLPRGKVAPSTQQIHPGAAMTQVTHPPKQDVRDFMVRRRESREPPPSLEEIRRQLGWGLVEAECEAIQLCEARSSTY
jgi:hypothetical protein